MRADRERLPNRRASPAGVLGRARRRLQRLAQQNGHVPFDGLIDRRNDEPTIFANDLDADPDQEIEVSCEVQCEEPIVGSMLATPSRSTSSRFGSRSPPRTIGLSRCADAEASTS